MNTTRALMACLLFGSTPLGACGGDDTSPRDTADTAVANETTSPTDVTPDTEPDTTQDTGPDASPETNDDDTSDPPDTTHEDVATPPECRTRTANLVEGLYQDTTLVDACDAGERCNTAKTDCVAARCFPAADGFDAGVYGLDGENRGDQLEACGVGQRCDDATPYCERDPAAGLPYGAACITNSQCAGTDAFEGRCIIAPGGFRMSAGRCGHGCLEAADCGVGAHCAFMDSANPVCLADCPGSTPCPSGAACEDGDSDGRDECLPIGTEPTDVGAECTTEADCGGDPAEAFCVREDIFWLGGYCMQIGCVLDSDCPANTHCAYFGSAPSAGLCVADCGDGGTCARPDHGCWDIDQDGRDECAPAARGGGSIGSPCTSVADCGGGAGGQCWLERDSGVSGGYCTVACSSDGGCPDGSICQGRGSNGNGICMVACEDDGDCLTTQACFDADFDGRLSCVKRGDGPVAQNGACTTTAECATGPRGVCLGGANFAGSCSASCRSDDECDGASHCVLAEVSSGFCLAECTVGGAACLPGSGCVDFDSDGRTECGPHPVGFTPLGSPCGSAADCAPGDGVFCGYPDLICTRFCGGDGDCGSGGNCVDVGGIELCRASCTAHADCAFGTRCIDADGNGSKECIAVGFGLNGVGDACGGTASCQRGQDLLCDLRQPQGMCTRPCGEGQPCPTGSHCGSLPDRASTVCLADCATNADCRQPDGWACFDGDGDGSKECRPFGGGAAGVGEACKTAVDCDSGERARCLEGPATFTGVCSTSCDATATCGEAADCVTLPEHASDVCLPTCASDDACGAYYSCAPLDVSEGVCAYTCTTDADCRLVRGATTCGVDGLCVP